MSGLEVLGAVATAVGLAANACQTVQYIRSEYDKLQDASQKTVELITSMDSVYAMLYDIDAKMTDGRMRQAFDDAPHWAKSFISTMATNSVLLAEIEGMVDDMKLRSEWRQKFHNWTNADKIEDFTMRLCVAATNLGRINHDSPVCKTFATSDRDRFLVYAVYDYTPEPERIHTFSFKKDEAFQKLDDDWGEDVWAQRLGVDGYPDGEIATIPMSYFRYYST